MDYVPSTVFSRINPSKELNTNNCVYTYSYTGSLKNDTEQINDNLITSFKIPYSQNCFWTSYKIKSSHNLQVSLKFTLITDEGYTYNIMNHEFKQGWINFDWPIPACIRDSTNKSGVYVNIINQSKTPVISLQMKLAGYYNLFPNMEYYILCNNNYEYVFTNHEQGHNVVFNVEHYDYIRNILDNSQLIYTTNTY